MVRLFLLIAVLINVLLLIFFDPVHLLLCFVFDFCKGNRRQSDFGLNIKHFLKIQWTSKPSLFSLNIKLHTRGSFYRLGLKLGNKTGLEQSVLFALRLTLPINPQCT